ncbi:MAG: dioxygenase [Rubrivivax sp.]|nr:dioxygenase [Rubrivivax sp.]
MDSVSHPLPPVFLSHGSPMIALEPGPAGRFMQRLGPAIDDAFGRPRAIVGLSAHTLAREPVLFAAPRHAAVHDFGPFDPRLFTLRYDAPGAPDLAPRVAALLRAAGLPVHVSPEGGLDHGLWTALRYVYPTADVPVLPLGWPAHWTPARLAALGTALAPLAAQGVLLLASGSLTHNLRMLFDDPMPAVDAPEIAPSRAFRDWVAAAAARGDRAALLDWAARAPHAALMHPTDEHWQPFLVALGAGGDAPAHRIHDGVTYGCLAMDAYAFGAGAAALERALAGVDAGA